MATTTSKSTFTKPYSTGTSTPIFNASSLKPYMDQIFGLGQAPQQDLSNPFGYETNVGNIQAGYDAATNDAFNVQRQQGIQNLNRFDNINYQNRANTLSDARSAMLGGIQSNANTGANSAAIMQALSAGGQAGSMETTAALQELQSIAMQRQAAMSQNAVKALETSTMNKGQQASASNQKYLADGTLQGAIGSALGQAIQSAMAGANQESFGRDIESITETTSGGSGGSGSSRSYGSSGGSSKTGGSTSKPIVPVAPKVEDNKKYGAIPAGTDGLGNQLIDFSKKDPLGIFDKSKVKAPSKAKAKAKAAPQKRKRTVQGMPVE